MQTREVTITENQIVVDRQALLDLVSALDCGARKDRLPHAMDLLREPFFPDEVSSGEARKDFSMNEYEVPIPVVRFDAPEDDIERSIRVMHREVKISMSRPSNEHPRSPRKTR